MALDIAVAKLWPCGSACVRIEGASSAWNTKVPLSKSASGMIANAASLCEWRTFHPRSFARM